MLLLAHAPASARRGQPRKILGWLAAGLRVLLGIGMVAGAAGAQEVDTIPVMNRAHVTWEIGGATREMEDSAVVLVARARGEAVLMKSVDRSQARIGDTLSYTIRVSASGGDVKSASVVDTLPAGLSYIAGSLALDGAPQTDAADADAVAILRSTREVIEASLGAIPSNGTRVLTFRAVVASAEPGGIVNVAILRTGGQDISSAPVVTHVSPGVLSVRKTAVGETTVVHGQMLTWDIWYVNRAAVRVTGIRLIDTLPPEVAFVSATGGGAHTAGIIRWTLPDLEPRDSAVVRVVGRLESGLPGVQVVNVAVIEGTNSPEAADTATHRVGGAAGGVHVVTLTKSAAALDASVGDQVRFTIVASNRGSAADGLVVRDRLPDELALIEGSVQGADSTRRDGGEIVFYVSRIVGAAEDVAIRYLASVTSRPSGGVLRNVAVVHIEGESVPRDTAVAIVQVRRGTPVESRTVLGKVYYDANDNGRQDRGERGVADVQVVGAHGEIVRTDPDGRFSFRDVRAGTHALRLDSESLPVGVTLADRQSELVVIRASGWTTPTAVFRLRPARVEPPRGARQGASASPVELLPAKLQHLVDTMDLTTELQPGEEPFTFTPLLSEAQRAADRRRDLVAGPAPRIFAPRDGAVIHLGRFFIGVRGEAGQELSLFLGDSLLETRRFRADGVFDFVGTRLPAGANVFRVKAVNSWGQVRWDSIAVYRPGLPASFIRTDSGSIDLQADIESRSIRIRVVDSAGLQVKPGTMVEVAATNAVVLQGASGAAETVQTQVEPGGWVTLALRGGSDVGVGELTLKSERAESTFVVRVFPAIRDFVLSGVGQIGSGGADANFGAFTARGALDDRTAIRVSVDSRRTEDDVFFAREYDVLDQTRYPVFGDRSQRQVVAPSKSAIAVRVERGFDWMEAGDLETNSFAREGGLLQYRRALTGAQLHMGSGPVTIDGFGSVTRQRLEHRQLRGDGTSGPYAIAADIRPGTERLSIEVRAQDNAARIISRRTLVRLTDYEIDYFAGTVVLRQPLASIDAAGNPVFLLIEMERQAGGESRMVGGVRIGGDLAAPLQSAFGFASGIDSLRIGGTLIRDGAARATGPLGAIGQPPIAGASGGLVGADVMIRGKGLSMDLEMLRADVRDSSGLAGRVGMRYETPGERFSMDATWQHVATGFSSSFDPRLVAGTTDLRLGIGTRLSQTAHLELRHERQRFARYGVERATTALRAEQVLAGRKFTQEVGLAQDELVGEGSIRSGGSLTARATAAMSERNDLWMEGSRRVSGEQSAARPTRIGAGVSHRFSDEFSLEGSHHFVQSDVLGATSTTGLKLKAAGLLGAQLWGGVERTAAATASHNAVLGLDRRFRITSFWNLSGMFERRFGLDRSPLSDPVRALPFPTVEQDRWSAALATEYVPGPDRARGTLKAEVQGGTARRGSRIDLSGDIPFGASAALLTRHDWSSFVSGAPGSASAAAGAFVNQRSIVGFAVRPTGTDVLNVIGKLEWRRTRTPTYGVALPDSLDVGRFIGAADVIWTADALSEVSLRYAMRFTSWSGMAEAKDGSPVAHYVGAAGERILPNRLTGERISARLDARYLFDAATGTSRWNVASSAIFRLTRELQVEAGWRAGELRDEDFGGASGTFLNLGVRFTEDAMKSAAAFWRSRL